MKVSGVINVVRAGLRGQSLEAFLQAESDSLFYWGVVMFGAGIGVYFLLPVEPSLWLVLAGLVALGALYLFSARHPVPVLGVRACLFVLMGMAVAGLRTELVATKAIEREMGPVSIKGTVTVVEERIEKGLRLTLENVAGDKDTTPEKLRIVVRTAHPDLAPGMRIETRAILLPLPEPVIPGGYDFGRQLWFEGLGAVGFAVAEVDLLEQRAPGITGAIEQFRMGLHARITAAVPGPSGGVAAALVTGIRDDIPEAVNESMRIAGLAHLLAISGLHMALVSGVLFLALRFGMAWIPALALKYNIKKIAAVGAFLGALAYLVLSGASLSTQRAFIMISVVLLAVLTDRQAISMRLVALAAIVVLVLTPEALLHPSFQMSFAAVIGLVAGYKVLQPRFRKLKTHDAGLVAKGGFYVLGVIVSTLIAELSIAPIALYHFGRYTVYGLLANLIAVPVMGFWVMPTALLGLALWPLGLDAYVWQIMAAGISIILGVADFISALPGADLKVPSMPLLSLVLILFSGLWLCLWHQRGLRKYFFIPLIPGIFIYLTHTLPDIVMDRDGRLFAVRGPGGAYYFNSLSYSRFSRENWQQHFAQRDALKFADFEKTDAFSLECDLLGCLYQQGAWKVAITKDPAAFAEDCQKADIILSSHYAPFACKDQKTVIDRARILDFGAHAIWLGNEVEIRSVGEERGQRPWVIAP